MARLTREQRRELANIRDEGESDIVAAIRDLAACILRLDEEAEPVHPSHLTTVVERLECERDEARAERDEANAMLGQLESAFSAAVCVVIKTGHHRTTPVLAEAVGLIVAERDEARAVRANQEATIEDLSEALASAIDVRDELWAKLENACSERDGARAKLADVDRLLAIEEQAKRVARAEKWLRWARATLAEETARFVDDGYGAASDSQNHETVVRSADALRAERRKLAEMVGEGES